MVTLIGSAIIAFGALLGIYLSGRASLRQAHRQAMASQYEEIVQVLWDQLHPARGRKAMTEEDLAARLFKVTKTLVVWGSDGSVRAWRDYRRYGQVEHHEEADTVIDQFDKLLRAFREDMGHANAGITAGDSERYGDLIGLFLTDAARVSPSVQDADSEPAVKA